MLTPRYKPIEHGFPVYRPTVNLFLAQLAWTMSTEGKSAVDVDSDRLRIDGLEITNNDVIEYVTEREDQTPDEVIRLAIRIGISTLRLSETTVDMEYVRHEFAKINHDFAEQISELEDDLDEWFDEEEGDFAAVIENTFGKNGDIIDEVFDHTNDSTPMGKLYKDFEEKLRNLREELIKQEAREGVEQQTTIKGERFQEDLESMLGSIVRKVDEIHSTGDEYGQLDDRLVGDFVITLGETGQDIVIEAKDVSQLTKPSIKEELIEGMENRGADYGILVLKNQDAASEFLGTFREFDQRMLYVAISDEESETYDRRLLNLAYEWARMRTLSSRFDMGDEVDPERIQNKVAGIEEAIGEFRKIRTQCSNIETAREKIEEQLESIQNGIEDEIEVILNELDVGEDIATG